MKKFNCPHCNRPTLSWLDKYMAAKWKVVSCPSCGSRVCSAPLILASFYILYLADVINFSYLGVLLETKVWFVVAFAGWLILDFFSVYLPLRVMHSAGVGRPANVRKGGDYVVTKV